MGNTSGSAPHPASMPEKMAELNSGIAPGRGRSVGGTISSPVGMMPTTGFFSTGTRVTPLASIAPAAAGVMTA